MNHSISSGSDFVRSMPFHEHALIENSATKDEFRLHIDRFKASPLRDSFGLSIESELGPDEITGTLLQPGNLVASLGLLRKHRILVLNQDTILPQTLSTREGIFVQEHGPLRTHDPAIDHAFWFWHFDEIKNGITHLHATDCDYRGASETVFYDVSRATEHLVAILPEFIGTLANLSFSSREAPPSATTPVSGEEAKRLLDEAFQEWLQLGQFIIEQTEHLHILQKASVAFQHLLLTHDPVSLVSEFMVNKREYLNTRKYVGGVLKSCMVRLEGYYSRFTQFAQIIESFENIPAVRSFLVQAHKVDSSGYVHRWQPNQSLLWSGDDKSLVHARRATQPVPARAPLERAVVVFNASGFEPEDEAAVS